jgi:hypothetical protein
MSLPLAVIVTTIQPPTPCMRELVKRLRSCGASLIVVGDEKGPDHYDLPGARLLRLADQFALPIRLAKLLPTGHYARKNAGYLEAIRRGATCIYETDDDNAPGAEWKVRQQEVSAALAPAQRWVNVYRFYTDEYIWPRGFPLDQLNGGFRAAGTPVLCKVDAPIQQGLVDGSPDVDAVWRLVMDRDIRFARNGSIALGSGSWCPFNTQSTWWWPLAFPLMYLPSHCTFRMTDIWRGFVAQRCLWAMGKNLVFHGPEVEQHRNEHSLMRDFESEVPGYVNNNEITSLLEGLKLETSHSAVGRNLVTCYQALVEHGFMPVEELALVEAWLADLEVVSKPSKRRLDPSHACRCFTRSDLDGAFVFSAGRS